MVEVDIDGAPGGKPYQGSYKGTVEENGQRGPDYATAKRQRDEQQAAAEAQRLTNGRDYERAEIQRQRRERAESAQWRKNAQSDESYRRRLDQQHEKELRQNDARLAADQKLMHAYRQLEHRARSPLTPSSWNAWQRASNTLALRADQHQQKYGSTPFSAAQLRALRESTGSENAAFGVGNILRLGNIGQRQNFSREWTGLARTNSELRKIENTLRRQLEAETNPQAKANIQRQVDSIYTAKRRIEAGSQGTSKGIQKFGKLAGKVGLALENPELAAITATVGQVVAAPFEFGGAVNAAAAASRPYMNWRMEIARLGRAGGYNSAKLRDLALPHSYANRYLPGTGLRGQLYNLGLGPQDVARISSEYATPINGARAQMRLAMQVRRAAIAPYTGALGEHTLAQMAGQAVSAGAAQRGRENEFFAKLQRVFAIGSREGMNESTVGQGIMQLITSSAAYGGRPDLSAATNFWARMQTAGYRNPGAAAVSLSQAANESLRSGFGLGGSATNNAIMGSWLASEKYPGTENALREALGVGKKAWDRHWVSTPVQQAALQNYLKLEKTHNPAALNYLAALIQGQPNSAEVLNKIYRESPMVKSLPAGYRAIAERGFLGGVSTRQALGLNSVGAQHLAATGVGTRRERANQLMTRLQMDMGLTVNQSAGIVSNLMAEDSTLNPNQHEIGGGGGYGIAQWTGARKKALFAWAKAHSMNPGSLETQTQYLEFELHHKYKSTLENIRKTKTATGAARADFPFEGAAVGYQRHLAYAHGLAKEYASNATLKEHRINATGQIATLNMSRDMTDATHAVLTGFHDLAGATSALMKEFQNATTTLKGFTTLKGNFDPQSGVWLNHPADKSRHVAK